MREIAALQRPPAAAADTIANKWVLDLKIAAKANTIPAETLPCDLSTLSASCFLRPTSRFLTADRYTMKTKSLEEIKNNEVVRKRLAKAMARDCFRNTKLEDFHAGIFPSSKAGDYSDVKVVSPYGEIGWERLSRLSDEEMKALMIDVVNHCYDFLTTLCGPFGDTIVEHLKQRDLLPRWNDPESKIS